jgi:cell division protein FtsL
MTRGQFMLLLSIAIICVCLSVVSIIYAYENRRLQESVQSQQAVINKGALSQQIGANLVREMAAVAKSDPRMQQLLADSGYKAPPQAAPTARP